MLCWTIVSNSKHYLSNDVELVESFLTSQLGLHPSACAHRRDHLPTKCCERNRQEKGSGSSQELRSFPPWLISLSIFSRRIEKKVPSRYDMHGVLVLSFIPRILYDTFNSHHNAAVFENFFFSAFEACCNPTHLCNAAFISKLLSCPYQTRPSAITQWTNVHG